MARKILLADDSVTAQNMGRKILADAGYEVIAVNNGSAALKKIAEVKPDLVILDIYMPGYSGIEICQRLKDAQETSRMPVLLSVGKLEPFKPEEAQRARADAFIVKPFEASELLSALSKLEDKVVPRPEPSKPGRFARAIAAVEESSRGLAAAGKETKSSPASPPEKAESAERVIAESSPYNPMGQDRRAPVKRLTASEEAKPQESSQATEPSAGATAANPQNILRDATAEEVAAIAAAVAQMQKTVSDSKLSVGEESQNRSFATDGRTSPGLRSPGDVPGDVQSEVRTEVRTEVQTEVQGDIHGHPALLTRQNESLATMAVGAEPQASESPDSADPALASLGSANSSLANPGLANPGLANSSSANSSTARWTAVSMALDSEEALVSLEREMRHAYAPVTTEANYASAFTAKAPSEPGPGKESGPAENSPSEHEPAEQHSPEALSATAGIATIPEPVPFAAAPSEAAATVSVLQVAAPPTSEPAESNQEPAAQAEPAIAQAAAASTGGYGQMSYAQMIRKAELDPEPDAEFEVVKNTAAAWASWRQIRDTNTVQAQAGAPAEAKSPQLEATDQPAATAVAAGAQQIAPEFPSLPPSEDHNEVASIVDSVLADLRPRLMAEISKKMLEKK